MPGRPGRRDPDTPETGCMQKQSDLRPGEGDSPQHRGTALRSLQMD